MDDLALDLLREQHRRTTLEFHLQRVLHDLANHVHAVELRASFLQRTGGGDGVILDEILRSCGGAQQRLHSLAEEAGVPRHDPIRLLEPIARAAALARRDGGVIQIAPELERLPEIPGCADDLAVLFVHLFDNAREAGGAMQVGGAVEDGRVVVRVADDGPGISPDAGARIWKPFFTTKSAPHRGHGLPLAALIARRSGGSLERQGSTFVVKLAVR